MDLNSIRAALHCEPFLPFTLCLSDGRRVAVNHPEFLAMNSRIVVVTDEECATNILEPLSIVSLEHSVGKPGNGSRRKKR